jgi:hypothetical protein
LPGNCSKSPADCSSLPTVPVKRREPVSKFWTASVKRQGHFLR